MSSMAKKSRAGRRVAPCAKVWLEIDGQYVFGRGISDILKAIAHTGSIKAAADELGKSYRHIWARVKEAEQALGASLVRTQVGGKQTRRSELTELGSALVDDFDKLRQKVLQLVEREFQKRLSSTLAHHRRVTRA